MGKKLILVLLATVFLFTTFGLAFAEEKGNPRKGKFLFGKKCSTCHKRSVEVKELSPSGKTIDQKKNAEGKKLIPSSKTMDQWVTAFKKETIDTYKCKDEFAKLKESDVYDIFIYLHKNAADSPPPLKCE